MTRYQGDVSVSRRGAAHTHTHAHTPFERGAFSRLRIVAGLSCGPRFLARLRGDLAARGGLAEAALTVAAVGAAATAAEGARYLYFNTSSHGVTQAHQAPWRAGCAGTYASMSTGSSAVSMRMRRW